jgi:hypothetical protein
MLTTHPISEYLVPAPTSLPALDKVPDAPGQYAVLAAAFTTTAEYRQAIRRQHELFEEFFQELEQSKASSEDIYQIATEVERREKRDWEELGEHAAKVNEKIRSYRRNRSNHIARSVVRLGEEVLDIAVTWVDLYQNFRIRLLDLASKRMGGESQVFSRADDADDYLRGLIAG